ncbi:MAG TPA: hypothetical protein VMD09_11205 [Solirubrobacteraceae bacterium]|nr:hypothetical protein [Solirubrobacteraceae bacterium]
MSTDHTRRRAARHGDILVTHEQHLTRRSGLDDNTGVNEHATSAPGSSSPRSSERPRDPPLRVT